jgi:hypothetical protein
MFIRTPHKPKKSHTFDPTQTYRISLSITNNVSVAPLPSPSKENTTQHENNNKLLKTSMALENLWEAFLS